MSNFNIFIWLRGLFIKRGNIVNTFAKGILERKSFRFSLFYIVCIQKGLNSFRSNKTEKIKTFIYYFANCFGGVFSLRSSNLYPSACNLSMIVGRASCTNAVFGISCISKME